MGHSPPANTLRHQRHATGATQSCHACLGAPRGIVPHATNHAQNPVDPTPWSWRFIRPAIGLYVIVTARYAAPFLASVRAAANRAAGADRAVISQERTSETVNSYRPAPGLCRHWAIPFYATIFLLFSLSATAQFQYQARIDGVSDPGTLALLQGVSETWTPEGVAPEDPPASLLHLRRRAERDVERFMNVFRSRGFYGAKVALDVDLDAKPVVLRFETAPGAQYTYGDVTYTGIELDADPEFHLSPEELSLKPGAPALAAPIAGGNAKIVTRLRNQGFPAPRVASRDVVVDHASQTVNITFHVEPGARAIYDKASYTGLERVRPVVVDRLLPWSEGEPFDQRHINELRTRLYDTGLFATASVSPLVADMGDGGELPMKVEVTERPPRTMSAGVEYKSDEGIGTQFRWEHRNIRGLGHQFSVDTTLATELREIDLRYHIDRFRRLDQAFSASFLIAQEEREAFDSDRVQALAFVERDVTPRLVLAVGAGIRIGQVEQRGESQSHELLYFPLELRLDQSDDPLDPSKGFKLRTRLEPYIDPLGELQYFLKTDLEFSHYLAFGSFETAEKETLPNWVLASRIRMGAIVGASRDDVPADIRFYGGGGGSIRGYRFQTVSPLIDDDPIGGNSIGEFSIEIRRRLSETLGLVAFIDGGAAFDSSYPDFSGDIQFGAGVGARYYTPLGPLRFDIAVPLNKRSEIDDAFQIYLSIGHAF